MKVYSGSGRVVGSWFGVGIGGMGGWGIRAWARGGGGRVVVALDYQIDDISIA